MVQAPSELLTLQAFLTLPETEPASEYIDGQISQKPMPQGKHSRLQLKLATAVNAALEEREIASAFPELRCTFRGRSIVPDISVLIWDRIPLDENSEISDEFCGYPDWMIEVLSPGQSPAKVTRKILHSVDSGTQMGWLIIPSKRQILTYSAAGKSQLFQDDRDTLALPAFASPLCLTLGDVFGWLKLRA